MSTEVQLNNGTKIPSIGLGVYLTPPNQATQIVYDALDVGYKHVDSAAFYQNEQEVCEAIAKWLKDNNGKREDIYYTTKITHMSHGYEEAKMAVAEALEKAKSIGYIDLMLIHAPLSNKEKRLATWKALQECVDAGKIKSIGVSNYGIHHLEELLAYDELKYKPVVNQIEIHPWLARKELVKFTRDNGIEVQAYSPLARGMLFGDKDVVAISEKYGVTEAQVLIHWSINRGFIALPKTVTKSRLQSNLDAFSFKLTDEEMAVLDSKDVHHVTVPEWDPTTYVDP